MGTLAEANVTLQANSALAAHLRVKFSSGKLVVASGAEDELGTLAARTLAADEYVAVIPRGMPGVRYMVASEAISQFAQVYAAASGKIAATGTLTRGFALDAATADNNVIRVLYDQASLVGSVARSQLTEDALQSYAVPIPEFRTWDALSTALPVGAGTNDDLGIVTGTLGTDAPMLQTADAKVSTKTQYALIEFPIPPEYVDAGDLTLVLNAGMVTTVSDGTAVVDAQVYRQAAPTTDICATAEQSINSLTAADKSFTLTATNVVRGDLLIMRVKIAITDTATLTAVIGALKRVTLKMDVKG